MKVNFGKENYTARMDSLMIGSCFLADRKEAKDGRGIYLRVDENSGILPSQKIKTKMYAVNLETGQLRSFDRDARVEPINAEVKVG